jgi:hypothetical protein
MDCEPMTWVFEPIPDDATWERKYVPAMHFAEQQEADGYFERLVEHTMRMRPEVTREEAEQIERHNIGYWTGYQSQEVAERTERLFNTCHPMFGPAAWRREYTADELIQMGLDFAERLNRASAGSRL